MNIFKCLHTESLSGVACTMKLDSVICWAPIKKERDILNVRPNNKELGEVWSRKGTAFQLRLFNIS